MKNIILYNNYFDNENFDNIIEDYCYYNEVEVKNDDEKWNIYNDTMDQYWYDFKDEIKDITFDNDLLILADLGLWNGRKFGYKEVKSNNLLEAIYSCIKNSDYIKIYIENNNFKIMTSHHDGRDYFTIREIKNADNIDNYLNKIYNHSVKPHHTTYYTRNIIEPIKNLYF